MKPQLSKEQQRAVDLHHGFLEMDGNGSSYVVLSSEVFREMMGVGDDAGYAASLRAIEEGLADVEAGRTRAMEEFFREFDGKHGIPS